RRERLDPGRFSVAALDVADLALDVLKALPFERSARDRGVDLGDRWKPVVEGIALMGRILGGPLPAAERGRMSALEPVGFAADPFEPLALVVEPPRGPLAVRSQRAEARVRAGEVPDRALAQLGGP